MTSDAREVFVWAWLPGAVAPVVAGRLLRRGDRFDFAYGRSCLDRADAIPLYDAELPLRTGTIETRAALDLPGCLRDALPDAWGRRVLVDRLMGSRGAAARDVELDETTYMLESGSNRIGALDFQSSAEQYAPRDDDGGTLDDLHDAAQRVERGEPLPDALSRALFHGTSIGGARPKAVLRDGDRQWIAKFSSSQDTYDVVRAELVAMRLAHRVGLNVARVEATRAQGRDVLLVERFDRTHTAAGWTRRGLVSALTLLGEHELGARHASYVDIAAVLRAHAPDPAAALHELFDRLVFNVLIGNTDDHARNHAAFWDGRALTLTPAYDVCPQPRPTHEANQALCLVPGDRRSRLATCVTAAPAFLLSEAEARARVERLVDGVVTGWPEVCDEVGLPPATRRLLAERSVLAAYAFEGFGAVRLAR